MGDAAEEAADGIDVGLWEWEGSFREERLAVASVRPRPGPRDSLCWLDRGGWLALYEEVVVVLLRPSTRLVSRALLVDDDDDTSVGTLLVCACPNQKSHSSQPKTVPALPQLTTDTGETRS